MLNPIAALVALATSRFRSQPLPGTASVTGPVQAPDTEAVQFPLQESTAYASSSMYGTQLNWPRYNPDELLRRKGPNIYDEMMHDEQVKAVMHFKRDAVLSREFVFQYEKDSKLALDEQQRRIDILTCMVNGIKGSFVDAMSYVLKAQRYGYSLTEKIYDFVELEGKNYYSVVELRPKPPFSFYFKIDEFGDLMQFGQNFGGQLRDLDLRKFVHYVNDPSEDLWFGRSELRAAYRSWFSKDVLIKLQNIWAERMAGGFLSIERDAAAQPLTTNDLAAIQNIIANVKTVNGILLPAGLTSKMVNPPASEAFSSLINYHDLAIAKALLVPNLLGISSQSKVGAYSQSQTQLEAFFWTLNADSARLEAAMNEQMFFEICEINFADGEYPKFGFKPASEEFIKWVIGQWSTLVTGNAVITTEADEAHLRKILNMPPRGDKDKPLAQTKAEQATMQPGGIPGKAPPGAAQATSNPVRQGDGDIGGAENYSRSEFGDSPGHDFRGNQYMNFGGHASASKLHQAIADDKTNGITDAARSAHREAAAVHNFATESMAGSGTGSREVSKGAMRATGRANAMSPSGLQVKLKTGTAAEMLPMQPRGKRFSRAHTHDGAPRSCSKIAFTRATMRVNFSVISQRGEDISSDGVVSIAPLIAQATAKVLKNIPDFVKDPATIQDAAFSGTDIGKIKKAFNTMLQRGWQLGTDQALQELRKAKAPSFSKVRMAAIRGDQAAQFLEANGFRMAGNLTDGAKAIIQQELQNAVKSGARPEDVAADIYERLIAKGFTDMGSVQDAVDDRDTKEALAAAVGASGEEGTLAYLSTLARTNTFEALNEARFDAFTDPALDGFVEALEYSAILDDRTTEICSELDGSVWSDDSDEWDTYRPPNHYNCRSILVPITKLDGWDGEESPEPSVEPQDGFGSGSK